MDVSDYRIIYIAHSLYKEIESAINNPGQTMHVDIDDSGVVSACLLIDDSSSANKILFVSKGEQ